MSKFLHLICGTTFFGIMIAAFFYISRSIHKGDRDLINYSLRTSYFGDGIIFFIALTVFITAITLVSKGHFTPKVPWIFVAYHAFGAIILLWLGILFIKLRYLSKTPISAIALKIFYGLNIMIILIFMIIIHDAVTQSTWFNFLLGK